MSESSLSTHIATTVRDAGVTHVFVYPGDPIINLLESFRAAGVDALLARRETTAAVMAEATGVLTGIPGVCVSTLGPGSTAMVGGVASANLDRAPVVALSGQIERAREPFFTHQVVDHERLYAPITKWTGHIEPASAATILRKAFRTATAERPGAVHLSMHDDMASKPVTDRTAMLPPLGPPQAVRAGFTLSGGTEQELTSLLGRSRRPLIIAGASVARNGATDELAAFAEARGIPVVVAPMAKGIISEEHEYFAGVLDMACTKIVWGLIRQSDLLILVGFDGVELLKSWEVDIPAIHIDAIPNTDQIYVAELELVGDVASALAWLSELPGEPRWTPAEIAAHRVDLRNGYEAGRVEGHLNPTDVVEAVRAAAGDDAICTTDVGSHKLLVGQGWRATRPRSVLMSNGLSAMGFAMPAAIAAGLCTKRPVYCFVGDGGFAMTQSELGLAAENKLPIVFIVMCDNSLNLIELKQHFRSIPSTATRLSEVDVVQIAQGLGCDAERASDVSSLEKCLAAGAKDRPLVIEAPIDPAQYLNQF
jgi:acetolactate synthase-1/2/3 large subunit